jgi:formate dehydrogenase subunit gamma
VTQYIQRHSLFKRVIHGIHTVACLILIASGVVVFVPSVGAALGSDTVQIVRLAHRIFAVVFIAGPLVGLIVAPKGFVKIVKNLTVKWDDDDKKFMAKFPKYMFAAKTTHMPPQHEVKSGQRLADGGLLLAAFGIAVSGVFLWIGTPIVSLGLFKIMLLIHDICFLGISIIMVAHIYLGAGVFQPYRGLGRLMFGNGRVTVGEARYHWGHWADEELAKGDNVIEA